MDTSIKLNDGPKSQFADRVFLAIRGIDPELDDAGFMHRNRIRHFIDCYAAVMSEVGMAVTFGCLLRFCKEPQQSVARVERMLLCAPFSPALRRWHTLSFEILKENTDHKGLKSYSMALLQLGRAIECFLDKDLYRTK